MDSGTTREPLGYLSPSPLYESYVVLPVPPTPPPLPPPPPPFIDVRRSSMDDGAAAAGGRVQGGGGGAGQQHPRAGGVVAKIPGETAWMRELREWMKSLRLHKYTDRLLALTYDELVALTDRDLQRLNFTDGAKGKFLKHLSLMNDRPRCIRDLIHNLEEINELRDLLNILPEMEKIVMMPMPTVRPATQQQQQQQPTTSGGSTADVSGAAGALKRAERRHDSGSDSGTEQDHHGGQAQPPSAPQLTAITSDSETVQQLAFELLEKTFSTIICRQQDDRDRDRVVMHFFRLVERRCLRREAFAARHKAAFQTWLKRMDQVWDISSAMVAAEMEAKRKYSHDFPMRRSSLHSPSPRSSVLCPAFPRGLSPVSFASYGAPPLSALGSQAAAATTAALLASSVGPTVSHGGGLLQPPPCDHRLGGQRRSVPDLNPPPVFPMQLKRNSYQGEHRMPPLVDSEVLNSLLDHPTPAICSGPLSCNHSSCAFGRRASSLSISSWDSGLGRRNSSLSSGTPSDDSRRNSSLSSCTIDSRRNSSLSDDSGRSNPAAVSAVASELFPTYGLGGGAGPVRRHSAMSSCSDSSGFLSVDSAAAMGGASGGRPSPSSISSSPAANAGMEPPSFGPSLSPRGSFQASYCVMPPPPQPPPPITTTSDDTHPAVVGANPSRMSGPVASSPSAGTGCATDPGPGAAAAAAAAESLEQDLHNLSLAVTEQALE